MDSITAAALEEICAAGPSGVPVDALWPKLHPSLSAAGLDLCPGVRAAVWSALLAVPSIRFVEPDGSGHSPVQLLEDAESLGLRVVAADRLRESFVGLYDLRAADSGITLPQRRALELLGAARTNGITQSQLAKEFDKNGNNMFFIVKNLECQGLVTRHSTVVRMKDVCSKGESSNRLSVCSTNMIHLSRYSTHLGSQHRLEITKEDNRLNHPDRVDDSAVGADGTAGDCTEEEVLVKDFIPSLKAICDKLEAANRKVLLVSDIKKDLGYRFTAGHRRWRNICKRLKDAGIVEEFTAKVNNKESSCLRLLKSFSAKLFEQRSVGFGDDTLGEHMVVKLDHKHKITDQLVELPVEHQIFDMINAEGPAGLTFTEVCRRLGINNKKNYNRLLSMCTRFGMHMQPEICNKGKVYRVWTSGNFNPSPYNAFPSKSESLSENGVSNPHVGDLRNFEQSDKSFTLGSPSSSKGATPEEVKNKEAEVELSQGLAADDECIYLLPSPRNPLEVVDDPMEAAPNTKLDLVSVATESNGSLASPSALSKQAKTRSYKTYPCLTVTAESALREQRILELLQEEKFILRAELHRWLESLDQDKSTVMDRKTLIRTLNKLQKLGHCKCIDISVPVATNCRRSRPTQVVLHPSVQGLPPELLGQIHDRMRSFDMQIRREGSTKSKKELSVPVLADVQRIAVDSHSTSQSVKSEAMRANGFVIAKMVRVKLLHIFLWNYLNSLPALDDASSSGNLRCDMNNPHSSCKLFVLDAAIKALPLELFLQIVGSVQPFDDLIEKCKSGLRLSDLPVQEYKSLMDTHAMGRLSWLVDILRRLKLIRVVPNGPLEDQSRTPQSALVHAMELKPYIEEPVSILASSASFISIDLRPRKRHDFILSNRKAVDVYWETLEYCYYGSDQAAALHAFPGSTVHEVLRKRSWASVRVMTAEQRSELLKRIGNKDPGKKLSFQECEKIAKDLGLTLQQVLRLYYEKRQQRLKRSYEGSNSNTEKIQTWKNKQHSSSRKRKRASERESLKDVEVDNEDVQLGEQSGATVQNTSSLAGTNLDNTIFQEHVNNLQSCSEDYPLENIEEPESHEEDEENHSFISQCAIQRVKPLRQKKFPWTEAADRQLIIQYVRHRAVLGAKYHRVEWSSLADLPGPPSSCRRRMHFLKNYISFRKSLMRLCNVLSKRYAKHLDSARIRLLQQDGSRPVIHGAPGRVLNRKVSDFVEKTQDSDIEEEQWDDFNNQDVKVALDEVLRHKKMAKQEVSKRSESVPEKYSDLNMDAEECDQPRNLDSSGTPSAENRNCGRRWMRSNRGQSRRHLLPKFVDLSKGRTNVDRQACESLAVSSAVELFKLVFLSSSTASEVPKLLAETLRRYSEHDLCTAFNYLREKRIMVASNGSHPFVLSQQFLQSISSSPFPANTGTRAAKFASWLQERKGDMVKDRICLYSDLECGDIFHLFGLVSLGELSVMPCLPDEGFGEAEDTRNIKRKADINEFHKDDPAKRLKSSWAIEGEINSRRIKGFPGITILLSREMISMANDSDLIQGEKSFASLLSFDENAPLSTACNQEIISNEPQSEHMKESQNHESCKHLSVISHESQWEAMTNYAKILMPVVSDEEHASPFCPEQFRNLSAAIQRAGDQGLCMKEVSEVLPMQGEDISEIMVEVLQAFGRVLKVNAYESVHVVDALYQPKYFLTSTASYSEDQTSAPSANVQRRRPHGHFVDQVGTNFQEELKLNDDVHRITILNLPELAPQPSSDITCNKEIEGCTQIKAGRTHEYFSVDTHLSRPILPWINGDGTINSVVYKGLTRRVFGIVMQNPGILEDDIINRMDALNPQSCRKLLELMILDNHLIVRKMHETTSGSPPSILGSLMGGNFKEPKSVFREHFFAYPPSTTLL